MLSLPYDLWSEWTKSQSSDEDSKSWGEAWRQALGTHCSSSHRSQKEAPRAIPSALPDSVSRHLHVDDLRGRLPVTALSGHRGLASLEGWGVLVGEGHTTFRDRMFGEQTGCDDWQTLPGPRACRAHGPGGGAATAVPQHGRRDQDARALVQQAGRSCQAHRHKPTAPTGHLKHWCAPKGCLRPGFQGNTSRVFQKKR